LLLLLLLLWFCRSVLSSTQSTNQIAAGTTVVDAVATVLRKYPSVHVLVDGHATGLKNTDYLLDLSSRRAAAVRAELVRQGVRSDHVEAKGSGAVGRGMHVFITVTDEMDDAMDTAAAAAPPSEEPVAVGEEEGDAAGVGDERGATAVAPSDSDDGAPLRVTRLVVRPGRTAGRASLPVIDAATQTDDQTDDEPDGDGTEEVFELDDTLPSEAEQQRLLAAAARDAEAIRRTQGEIDSAITGREIAFIKNQDILLTEGIAVVDAVASVLREHPHVHVLVDGHAMGVKQAPYLLDLSARRAAAVKAELVRQGVSADHVEAKGSGVVGRGMHVFITAAKVDASGGAWM
jgi:outer membrane protein OmpA-like peptidoglycan-associated protein